MEQTIQAKNWFWIYEINFDLLHPCSGITVLALGAWIAL